MRTSLSAVAAFVGTASAALAAAPAYIFPHSLSAAAAAAPPPALSAQTARLILEQRLNTPDVFLGDGIDEASREAAIAAINAFGRPPKPLFGAAAAAAKAADVPQLVVLIEGLADDQIERAMAVAAPHVKPAFTIADPPSSMAHSQLLHEHPAANAAKKCELADALKPQSSACWDGASSLVRFDAQKDASILDTLAAHVPSLADMAAAGKMHSVLIFFPESTRSSPLNTWSNSASELRRRQSAEAVMTESTRPTNGDAAAAKHLAHNNSLPSVPGTSPKPHASAPVFVSAKTVPECFKDADACAAGTNACSGHGVCVNRWGKDAPGSACFVCSCVKPAADGSSSSASTGYAGKACEKEDYSTPFALFVGFTVVMIGVLTFAISLLFQVGEEPLPGVIGAGVVKK